MTGLDIIKRALRTLGVIAPGESLPAAEAQQALDLLQAMFDTWRTQRLLCYVVDTEDFALTGSASYTYGPGGDFVAVRPVFLDRLSVVQNAGGANELEVPLRVIRTAQEWQTIHDKTLTSTWPTAVYLQNGMPQKTLTFWPVPSDTALTARIYAWVSITGLADLATVYTFAPGYEEAIVYNLALRLAPEWGAAVPPIVLDLAAQRMGDVKRTNVNQDVLVLDRALRRRAGYDIYADGYQG